MCDDQYGGKGYRLGSAWSMTLLGANIRVTGGGMRGGIRWGGLPVVIGLVYN